MATADTPHVKRTFTYKEVQGKPLQLDVYYPEGAPDAGKTFPTVLYFHGGGVITGDRHFQRKWFLDPCLRRGWTFVSADYRCMPESTGFDVAADLQAAYDWVARRAREEMPERLVDTTRIVLHGDSGGGYCAMLAATLVQPRPRAAFLLYPMTEPAGEHRVKRGPMWGMPQEDMSAVFAEIEERIKQGEVCFGEQYTWDLSNILTQERWKYVRAIFQEGVWVDYLTGVRGMRDRIVEEGQDRAVPEDMRWLFPVTYGISKDFPALVVAHGTVDSAVHLSEAEHLVEKCREVGGRAELFPVEGKEHAFDVSYEDVEGKEGDDVAGVLKKCIEVLEGYLAL